jgi:AraC-like DNA-binding protein
LFLPAAERIVIGNPGPHPLRYLTVLFRIHHKFGLHPLDFLELPIIRRASADNCLYADKLTEMAGEYAARRFARQLVAKAHLLQLLVYEIRRRPDIEAALSSGDVAGPLGKAFPLESLLHFIIQQPDHQPATAELARLLKVSETHLRRLFKQHVGMTPHAFVQQIKIRQSQTDLAHTMLNVSEIAMKYGFDSGNRFAKVFRQWTGCTPTEYRRTVNVQSNN